MRLGRTVTRPLTIITSSGIVTVIPWWSSLRVKGRCVVLDSAGKDDDSPSDLLVVAVARSVGEAHVMARTLDQRMRDGARRFDAREWPGVAPSVTTKPSATAEPHRAPGRRIRWGLGLTEADARRAVRQQPKAMAILAGKDPSSRPLKGTSGQEPDGDPPGE